MPELRGAAPEPQRHGVLVGLPRQRDLRHRGRHGAVEAVPASAREHALEILVRHDDSAILAEGFVAAGVVAMEMRVDEIADRLRRDGGDGGFDLAVHLREHVVHHDDTVVAHCDDDVTTNSAAHAFEHVDAVAEIGGPDHGFAEVWNRRRRQTRLRLPNGGKRNVRRRGYNQCRSHGTLPWLSGLNWDFPG